MIKAMLDVTWEEKHKSDEPSSKYSLFSFSLQRIALIVTNLYGVRVVRERWKSGEEEKKAFGEKFKKSAISIPTHASL